jgi:hypothetical protein
MGLLTFTHNSLYGPAAHKKKKEARDTLALSAKGFALCTPSYEWMSEVCSYPISRSYLLFLEKKLIQISFLFHI